MNAKAKTAYQPTHEAEAAILRRMLVPKSTRTLNAPFIVAASPLTWREAMKVGGGFSEIGKTRSDHVGIRGLIQAFGAVYGLQRLPELLNPDDFRDEVITERQKTHPLNLYSIGSSKANRWTGLILERLNELWSPTIEFRPDPRSRNLRNVNVDIHKNGVLYAPNGFLSEDRYDWDYGVLLRGPNPFNEACTCTILAGRSTLGTEAACYAATTPHVLSRIEAQLRTSSPGFSLDQHGKAFFACLHMKRLGHPEWADPKTLQISEVALLERRPTSASLPEARRPKPGEGKFDVFISYNSKDRKWARKLATGLKTRGLAVWFDEWCLPPGTRWVEGLESGLKASKTAAVLIGKNAFGAWHTVEWQAFLTQSIAENMPLIPVMLPDSDTSNMPLFLTQFQREDLRGGLTKDGLNRVFEGITHWTSRRVGA